MAEEMVYDVVTCGEGLLRLSPPRYERLEQSNTFEVHAVGAALEVAVGVQRMGLRTAWLSAVAGTPLGSKVLNKAQEHGVDTRHIYRVPEGRTGLCFVEPGSAPRSSRYLYDLDHSAFRSTCPDQINWAPLTQTRLYHVDATTLIADPAYIPWIENSMTKLADSGFITSVCLDMPEDYPLHDQMTSRMIHLVEKADLVVITVRALEILWSMKGSLNEVASEIKNQVKADVVAVVENRLSTPRTGRWQGVAIADTLYQDRAYTMEVIDAGGALSAFTAGFLYGYLTNALEMALQYGNAAAALAHSIPGHISWLTKQDLLSQIDGEGTKLQR
jgi:2-dehydro-3-deoxygluconokinase